MQRKVRRLVYNRSAFVDPSCCGGKTTIVIRRSMTAFTKKPRPLLINELQLVTSVYFIICTYTYNMYLNMYVMLKYIRTFLSFDIM